MKKSSRGQLLVKMVNEKENHNPNFENSNLLKEDRTTEQESHSNQILPVESLTPIRPKLTLDNLWKLDCKLPVFKNPQDEFANLTNIPIDTHQLKLGLSAAFDITFPEQVQISLETEINNDTHVDLTCHENIPLNFSPEVQLSPSLFVEDSDDSVQDKDYMPSSESSTSSEEIATAVKSTSGVVNVIKCQSTITALCHKNPEEQSPGILTHCRVPAIQGQASSDFRNLIEEPVIEWPSIVVAESPQENPDETLNLLGNSMTQIPVNKEQSITDIQNPSVEIQAQDYSYGGKGLRKKYNLKLKEREQILKDKKRNKYFPKPPCSSSCKKKCTQKFTDESRNDINDKFWRLSWKEQRVFIAAQCILKTPSRQNLLNPKKSKSIKYSLKLHQGDRIDVCKQFFLTTLGYNKNNDKVLYNTLDDINASTFQDKRGKHTKTKKIDRSRISAHINSFGPAISHYRRAHAPMRKYLSNELNVTVMYEDFCKSNPDLKVSYEVYRKEIKNMNISFCKLGHEECEICEHFQLHNTAHVNNRCEDCLTCKNWESHEKKYKEARIQYKLASEQSDSNTAVFSADLQKVIMLPRIDMFKKVIFCPRITVFNESFVPVGKSSEYPLAVLWHEAISGRKQEDLLSTFRIFLKSQRDKMHIELWLDNCSSQNKNWLLLSFMIYIVNSEELSAKTITLNYFEPGHTFMSADHFHHQVELSMKKKCKIYDFDDFVDVVNQANNGKVKTKEMKYEDFCDYKNFVSTYRIQKMEQRPYLNDMVKITFTRGQYNMFYKTRFDGPSKELHFLKDSFIKSKGRVEIAKPKSAPRGITSKRKDNILTKLSDLIPKNRLLFWKNLPVDDNADDLTLINDVE